jgi:ATP phosphoribosyltransferase regulatory subunit
MRVQPATKPKTLIPKGVATFLPEGVLLRRQIERAIFSVFFKADYQEVITPLFEYAETFSKTSGEESLHHAYQFVDRATGRMMVLRPDVTPQIARMAATLLADRKRPLRLCYSANLFRHEEEHAGQEREIFQMGAEQIGLSGAEADAEMIALAIDVLQTLRIQSFKIVLGQAAFTRGILSPLETQPVLLRALLSCISRKESSRLETLLKETQVETKTRKQILALPHLFGRNDLFKRAAAITDAPVCKAALKQLAEVYRLLVQKGMQKHLLIDLGEVRGFDYYTGTIFEVFAESVGVALGGGGRYDHLLEKFGPAAPSIGFALNIERVQQAYEACGADDVREPAL